MEVRMRKSCSITLAAILVAALSSATGAEAPETRPDILAGQLAKLSGSISERAAAVNALELADPKVVAPLVLERLKKNVAAGEGIMSRTDHMPPIGPEQIAAWVHMPSENVTLADLLVHSRAIAAAPAVRSALDLAMHQDETHLERGETRQLAHDVYLLTGKCPDCWNYEAKEAAPLIPDLYEEEAMRDIVRPDRIPTHNLTASVALSGKYELGGVILAGEKVTLRLALENHGKDAATLDLSPACFQLRWSDERTWKSKSADTLPEPRIAIADKPLTAGQEIPAGATVTLTWEVAAKDLFPLQDWGTSGHYVHMLYAPRRDTARKSAWGADTLRSNSLQRTCRDE
jgi:hypothetical protein